jgi:5-methylcytosine-specific restriction protein A
MSTRNMSVKSSAATGERKDSRSETAQSYRRLYKTSLWRALRLAQLHDRPLCERCEAKGFIIAATVVNHRKPHKGDPTLFAAPTNLESTCKPCHDGPIQSEETSGKPNDRVGYSVKVDAGGWPTDGRHRANRR